MAEHWVFLDYNSTTPLDPEVAEAMSEKQGRAWGNPSSVHAAGRAARKLLEEARERLAAQIVCDPGEVYFTSGGTESDNLAIKGAYFANPDHPRRVLVSAVEHPAVIEAADDLKRAGAQVAHVPVDHGGVVLPESLEASLEGGAVVASIMAANNETGTIQPVSRLAAVLRAHSTLFHTDAVQAVGKIEVDCRAWDVDMLSLTAHKFYGPRGIGALFVRRGVAVERQISGGGHERRRRAGTENVIGAWGMALALEKANLVRQAEEERLRRLQTRFVRDLSAGIPDVHFHGDPGRGLANTVSFSCAGVEGEAVVVSLDLAGICIASGSACSSGATEPSHVILAMGTEPRLAAGALRVSFGRPTTDADVDGLLAELPRVVERLRALSPTYVSSSR